MKKRISRCLISLILSVAMILGSLIPAAAVDASRYESAAAGIKSSDTADAYGKYRKCGKGYKLINKFRTKKKVWYWKKGSKKKKYFNTNKKNKLNKLKKDADLEKTAKERAKELASYYDHVRPNGKQWYTIYPKKFSIKGENIAYGYDTIAEVEEAWEEEGEKYSGQGHRRNILNKKFTKVGIACYQGKDGIKYWVQSFGG